MITEKNMTLISNDPKRFPMHYLEYLKSLDINFKQITTAIETGSHRGGGSLIFASVFEKVYSIELSQKLYEYCKNTYIENSINFIHGASTDVLADIIDKINGEYFIFLDAHGSGGDTTFDERIGRYGSPVLLELENLKKHPPAIIAIDDLYCFDDASLNYPSREQIIEKIKEIGNYSDPIIYYYMDKHPQWFCFKRID